MNPLPSPRAIQFGVLLTCILFWVAGLGFSRSEKSRIEWREEVVSGCMSAFWMVSNALFPDQLADVQILGKEESQTEPIASFSLERLANWRTPLRFSPEPIRLVWISSLSQRAPRIPRLNAARIPICEKASQRS